MPQAQICTLAATPAPSQGQSAPLPSIPMATDMQSAFAAINAIRAHLQQPTEMRKPTQPGAQGGGGVKIKKDKKKATGSDWQEDRRVTVEVRVENPDDPEQYVIVERINKLVMRNKKTGETWVWEHGR